MHLLWATRRALSTSLERLRTPSGGDRLAASIALGCGLLSALTLTFPLTLLPALTFKHTLWPQVFDPRRRAFGAGLETES